MSDQHSHPGSEPHSHDEHPKPRGRGLHRDWRIWAFVLLMLLAMIIYLATLDERIVPGGSSGGTTAMTNARAKAP
jgi:hypothetical protein